MRLIPLVSLMLAAALLCACGGKSSTTQATATGDADEPLPAPSSKGGAVTGMPDEPGPGPVGLPSPEQADVPVDENGNPLLPEESTVDTAESEVAGEPTPDDALNLLRGYYEAINSGDFGRAYAMWADAGAASGKSPAQFAADFADTTGVSVEPGAPGRVDAGAGSRFIEIPVVVTTTRRDGSQHRYAGRFVLRRAVVDGATAEQRAWRIASAEISESAP